MPVTTPLVNPLSIGGTMTHPPSRPPLASAVLLTCLSLSGCFAARISTHVAEPIRPRQPADVAILAVMPGVVEPGSEWIRPEAMQTLLDGLTRRFPSIRIFDPETTGARLADQSFA